MPGHIPADRLIANLTARLKKEPENSEIYYLIGRAHYAAFSRAVEMEWGKPGDVEIFDRDSLPQFYSIQGNIYPWDSKSAVRDTPENRRHIVGAISNLSMALALKEKPVRKAAISANEGLAHLTLACAFDSGALLASKVNLDQPYSNLKTTEQWRSKAAAEYLQSFRKAIIEDVKFGEKPLFGLQTFVAYEAGKSFLRLRPGAKEAAEVKAGVAKLEGLRDSGIVTPLVLDLSGAKSLSSLLNPSHKSEFDLDGTGRPQSYSWVKPTTAFLVWDPHHEGRITSGRQLFGNATWWMLWANAYSAMDALDNNRDGWLSGSELHGLALWYDRNGNGKCDLGEVVPIEQTSIVALRTRFDTKSGESLVSQSGVVLRDGRILPTYDWVVELVR